jgi:hypothetical protein
MKQRPRIYYTESQKAVKNISISDIQEYEVESMLAHFNARFYRP